MDISIRWKMAGLLFVLAFVSLIGYSMLFNNMSTVTKRYIEETKSNIKVSIEREAAKLNAFMVLMEEKAGDLAVAGQSFRRMNKAGSLDQYDMELYLVQTIRNFPDAIGGGFWYEPHSYQDGVKYYGPYAYWDKGNVVFTMEFNTEEYDYPNQEWYTDAIPKDWQRSVKRPRKAYWSKPYIDQAGTMALMVTVGSVMYDDRGSIIGMSTLDLSMENLRSQIEAIKITPTSIAFAVETRSGLITAYPQDNALVLKPVSALPFGSRLRELSAPGHGQLATFQQDIGGVAHQVFYTVTETGTGIGIAVPEHELMAEANALSAANRWTAAGVALLFLILLAISGYALNRSIAIPLKTLARYAEEVTAGNLNASIRGTFSCELGTLKEAMLSMLDALKSKMEESDRKASETEKHAARAEEARLRAEEATRTAENARKDGMRYAAEQLQDIAGAISSASTELSAQIAESSQGSATQSRRVDDTATAMEQMSASVIEIAKNAETTAKTSGETRSAAESGSKQVAAVKVNVDRTFSSFENVSEALSDLSRKADAIGVITQTIDDIADQTNLLALNAAIEAARAGEAGRGFAVVADEVRKLAEKTMLATKEVGESVRAIQAGVGGTLSGMDAAGKIIDQARSEAIRAEQSISDILGLAAKSEDQIRAIATSAEEQSTATEHIDKSIEEISTISTETNLAMQEASRAIALLNQQATHLNGLVERLKEECGETC